MQRQPRRRLQQFSAFDLPRRISSFQPGKPRNLLGFWYLHRVEKLCLLLPKFLGWKVVIVYPIICEATTRVLSLDSQFAPALLEGSLYKNLIEAPALGDGRDPDFSSVAPVFLLERCLCPVIVSGGVVALGKFDALHIGHRELAIQASRAGSPYLLSFVGMAEVLGWEQRSPVVAKCDRERVLALWAPYCGNIIPVEYQIEFSSVRHLSPRQFVERLSNELGVSGVVAGENYRFGYKASGDASELVRLCEEYGLGAYIVRSVMDRRQMSSNTGSKTDGLRERGQVSSTRVRHALAVGDMEYVSQLLGRPHRLVLAVGPEYLITGNRISAPKSCLLNQPPGDGHYGCCTALAELSYHGY
ncbi:FAD synthetase 1, chloroplastic-like isoform X3 [Aristolochia californica]|uniref:FAD synthetase 1, chloroplastic-like isoform X3 n=1 Tax=Aristolochia californica TaxID=171875 RepID=UPI0035E25987